MAQTSWLDQARNLLTSFQTRGSQFIKQNPTPAGFVNKQFQQNVAQPVAKYSAPIIKQVGRDYVSNARAMAQVSPPGQLISQLQRKPVTAQQGMQALGGAFQTTFPIATTAYRVGAGALGGAISAVKNKTPLAPTIQRSIIGNQPIGTTAFGSGPLAMIGNVAEFVGPGTLAKGAKPLVKGFDMGRNRFSKWNAQDVNELDAITDFVFRNRKMNTDQINEADRVITSLVKGYLPVKTVEKLAGMYGKNSRGFLKAAIDELHKSRAGQEAMGGISMGITSSKPTGGITKPGERTISTTQTQPAISQPLQSRLNKTATGSSSGPKTTNQQRPSSPGSIAQTTDDYLKELKGNQDAARKGESKTSLIKTLYNDIKRKFVDSTAPIEDALTAAEKKGNFQVRPTNDVRYQIDRVLRSPSLAGQFAKDNGLVDVIRQAPDLDALDQYMIAKHAKTIEATGRKTGRDLVKDEQLVRDLAPQYEGLAQQVTAYSRKLLDYAVDTGLVSKKVADDLKVKYPEYVPLQRIFDESEQVTRGTGRGPASVSSQSVVQKLKGSEREIESPIASLLAKTDEAFAQGERNIAARQLASYKDLPGNPLGITPLRTAENVKNRINLYEQAADLKPIQTKLYTFVKTHNRRLRLLQNELDRLNRQGLEKSLKQTKEEAPKLQSAIKVKNFSEQVKFGEGELRDTVVGGRPAERKIIGDIYATTKNRGQLSTKNFIENLINDPDSDIQAIKKKIATRENKLGPLLDDIQLLKDSLEGVKAQRGSLFDEARLLRDAQSRGKTTISVFNDGIKEIYEVNPEIAAAAKSLDRQQIGFLGKLLSYPTRIGRLGFTGINIPFVAANLVKDQLTAFVNSNHAAKTSLMNPGNFLRALFSAVKHDELYDEVVRAGAGGTSFDIGRQANRQTIDRIRAGRGIGSKIKYTVTHPGELLTAIEDMVGRSEEVGRIQQYAGAKQALQGRTAQDRAILAAGEARTNTANFARSGEWGKVLNTILPYFNAGIQGSRATVEQLGKHPVQTGAKLAVGLFTPVAASTLWNLSDPERKKVYEDIDDFEKENNIILILDPKKGQEKGRYDGIIKIPIQQGFGALSTGVRRGIEQAYGLDPVKAGEVAAGLIQFGTSLNVGSPRELMSSLTPQGLKVPIESMTNTNLFTGKQIVPQYMLSKPKEEQVYDFTSGSARLLGKAFNASPLKVQNAINTSFGGVGKQIQNAADTVLNKAGIIPDSQVGGESVGDATLKRFFSASGGKKLDEAYKAKDEKDNAKRQSIQLFLQGNTEGAKKLKEQYGLKITNADIKSARDSQAKKAAELFIEGKVDQAKELKTKFGLTVTNEDVVKAAKRKAIELFKLGLTDEAKALKEKYGFSVKKSEID